MTPSKTPAGLSEVLARDYGAVAATLAEAPRGFVAETFAVTAHDGRRYFVKWLPLWASTPALERGMAVAEQLRGLGLVEVINPVRTRAGAFTTALDGRTLAVFDFIEGRRGAVTDPRLAPSSFNYDFDRYVAGLARVHAATPRITLDLPRETFALPWADRLLADLERARDGSPSPAHAALARLLDARATDISRAWPRMLALQAAAQAVPFEPVLSHGDLIGDNVIIGADGTLHLIDWDEPLFAPVERDGWFYLNDAEGAAAFVDRYRQAFPAYAPSSELHAFYLFYRFFQDLQGYVTGVLDGADPTQMVWHVSELQKTCFDWLWPPMQRFL